MTLSRSASVRFWTFWDAAILHQGDPEQRTADYAALQWSDCIDLVAEEPELQPEDTGVLLEVAPPNRA